MNIKHTPGPWHYVKRTCGDGGSGTVTGPDNRSIMACNNSVDRTKEEKLANARLIAAAPDLLEALREAADILSANCDCGDCGPCNIERRDLAAIAKAQGGA